MPDADLESNPPRPDLDIEEREIIATPEAAARDMQNQVRELIPVQFYGTDVDPLVAAGVRDFSPRPQVTNQATMKGSPGRPVAEQNPGEPVAEIDQLTEDGHGRMFTGAPTTSVPHPSTPRNRDDMSPSERKMMEMVDQRVEEGTSPWITTPETTTTGSGTRVTANPAHPDGLTEDGHGTMYGSTVQVPPHPSTPRTPRHLQSVPPSTEMVPATPVAEVGIVSPEPVVVTPTTSLPHPSSPRADESEPVVTPPVTEPQPGETTEEPKPAPSEPEPEPGEVVITEQPEPRPADAQEPVEAPEPAEATPPPATPFG